MRETTRYRATEWIDPRVEIRQSPIHGKGMFASAPIKQGEIVNIWGGTLLLTEEDIAGDRAKEWRAKGYVWAMIDEGLYLAALLSTPMRKYDPIPGNGCAVYLGQEVENACTKAQVSDRVNN